MKKQNGITMVALIITIIILLILAGISIYVLSSNGLFEKAKLAKKETENGQIKENVALDRFENQINEYVSSDRETVEIDKEEYNKLKNANNYSSDEIEIGTWTDGKKVYRKVYTGSVSKTAQDLFSTIDAIDALVTVKGYLQTSDYKFPFNFTQDNSTQVVVFLKTDNKTFAYRGTETNGTYYLVIEYTKAM